MAGPSRPALDTNFIDRVRTFNTFQGGSLQSRRLASNIARAGFVYVDENCSLLCELCGLEISANLPSETDPERLHAGHGEGICSRYIPEEAAQETAGTRLFYIS